MDTPTEKVKDVVIVKLDGEINFTTANATREMFSKLLQAGEKKILIDFQKVFFIDSAGLAVVIETVQRLSKVNGKLRVFNVNQKVREIFEIVKIHKFIAKDDNRESALGEF